METLALRADSSSVALARAFVGRVASKQLEDAFVAELLTSELVTNVVRHAPRGLTVGVEAGPPFRVEVHDGRSPTEAFRKRFADPPEVHPTAHSGRGLLLLHELATRFGVEDGVGTGKIVWFELSAT